MNEMPMQGWTAKELADCISNGKGKISFSKDSPYHLAVPSSNLEPTASLSPVAEKEDTRLDSFRGPVHLLVTSYRHRLCDADGISAKAAIDALVLAGILKDDSSEFVKEVRYEQIKVENEEPEQTIIEIRECE